MHTEVKKCVADNDIKGLRYIFADALDVDPTFEKYKEDYAYCKTINGFFEPFIECTRLSFDKNQWNRKYWNQLKMDILKNFSEKRYEHMIQVAQIVYAEKIQRLQKERSMQKKNTLNEVQSTVTNSQKNQRLMASKNDSRKTKVIEFEGKLLSEEAVNEILMKRKKNAEENKRVEERIAQQNVQHIERKVNENYNSGQKGESESKKALGIAAVIVIVIILIIVMIIINQ
jgi:hypothetical protein